MCSKSLNSESMITVDRVSKCYQTYAKPVHRLMQAISPGKTKRYTEFWALNDVSFNIYKGETLGIVGKNGSGKSTLLQIIAGTLRPTAGSVECNGRIAAILELGAGFNPEFDGIENARLNAAIIGVSEAEFQRRLPEIIEFSGLGDFIHQPVKTYSSGMYVRLAFSVSISLNPDILIIDEALAVGDARFQRKCFRKLESLKQAGVTILFVSHSMESVVSQCDRAVYLNEGNVEKIGQPKEVVNLYLDQLFQDDNEPRAKQVEQHAEQQVPTHKHEKRTGLNHDPQIDNCKNRESYNNQEYRWGDGRASIVDYVLLNQGAESNAIFAKGDVLTVKFATVFSQAFDQLIYGMTIKTTDGKTVYGTNNRLQKIQLEVDSNARVTETAFEFKANLAAGNYFISLGVAVDDEAQDHIPLDRRYDLIHFTIEEDHRSFGIAELDAQISQESF